MIDCNCCLFLDMPLYSVYSELAEKHEVVPYKSSEPCTVDTVAVLDTGDRVPTKAKITLRYTRNPVIGDKFSSRYGQKGNVSLYKQLNI